MGEWFRGPGLRVNNIQYYIISSYFFRYRRPRATQNWICTYRVAAAVYSTGLADLRRPDILEIIPTWDRILDKASAIIDLQHLYGPNHARCEAI